MSTEEALAANSALAEEMRSTFKPRDVEELVDFWINRPMAARVVALFRDTKVTPNQVTAMSGVVGFFSGWFVGGASLEHPWAVPVGGVLLFLSILFDCADGQLARLRGQSSLFGRALDGYVDVIPTASVFVGFAVLLCRLGYSPIWVNVIGWSAGYSMKWQAHSYDHAKNVYLRNVLPPDAKSAPLPTYEEIDRERQRHAERGEWFAALVLRGFAAVTRGQRGGWQEGRMGLGVAGTKSHEERVVYRDTFRSVMRLWSWNGLASHLYLLLAAAALTPFYRPAALVAWFFMLGPMNGMTAYLMWRERRLERQLQARLVPSK